ncbi:sulfate adenylyltransferase subunit CysN [Polynucleobacter paneuropaeus]|nr:sulfate adenylyltransferase subunit CysN [Polynucleobacter paneuropaeus]MBT8530968.1 sulfate adenylyltransferase subunit CysN [Polynucleobacter paneuropaeus]MBT8602475.1 sulfate adenylyltransferase subunit CysN [Polynucleobacter paneuropaeus]MBT8624428.1 sulfate adenylyltransferase subunit CysN [Polynucleobacter paneuropaeus]MBT8628687.1 sulfate adenylyltransferase subunit CysN [Polynucleobacter paneuropaeus]
MSIENQKPNVTLDGYIKSQERKSLLRFITCGSVDDGKSTLIGRLLYDSKAIFDDQLSALTSDSKKMGTQGDALDFALLVDGLAAEREQGITIDVAYRFFSTERRKFIVADTPGHEQYTRNMVTGASTADLAVVLIDAQKGVLTQTRRHTYLAALMGIKHIILAVNKMDLVHYDRSVFQTISDEYCQFAKQLGIEAIHPIPVSAFQGDNITNPSKSIPWYKGQTLLETLENAPINQELALSLPFRLPVQWVNRPHQNFRGFAGIIASGMIQKGQSVKVQPSGQDTTVQSIVSFDGELDHAIAGQAITVTLKDEIDLSRGDVLSEAKNPAQVADQFQTHIIWMDDEPLFSGRQYLLKIGSITTTASITSIKHQININTLEKLSTSKLELNDIAVCNIQTGKKIVFESYADNPPMGSFILIDRISNKTAGAGMIDFALRRAGNIQTQFFQIDKKTRADINQQKPLCLWFTGLSGSGKSTIANALEIELIKMGKRTYILDGDNIRHGLCGDLGFTEADRIENVRRVSEVAKLMVDAGLIVMVTLISPYRKDREMAKAKFDEGEFIEIFIDTPLQECEKRDPKGLYKRARRGEIKNFTGIDSAYEKPKNPKITIASSASLSETILQLKGLIAAH